MPPSSYRGVSFVTPQAGGGQSVHRLRATASILLAKPSCAFPLLPLYPAHNIQLGIDKSSYPYNSTFLSLQAAAADGFKTAILSAFRAVRTRRERPSESPFSLPHPHEPTRCRRSSLRSKGGSSPCSPAKAAACAWLRFPAAPPLTSAAPGGLPEGRSAPRNIGLADLSKEHLKKRV